MARVALLDVNVLVALFDPDHVHHEIAHDWFAEHRDGWATCPLTENGLIRVITNPAYHPDAIRPAQAGGSLRKFRRSGGHHFWVDSLSLTDAKTVDLTLVRGHAQLTDIYLLGLAVKNDGCLVTFDGKMPLGAAVGATRDHLAVLGPVPESRQQTDARDTH